MAFNDDEKPPTANAGSTKGLVTMKPLKYFKEDAALTADTLTAELEIIATSSPTVREGLDLVAVLDVSGRIDGEKMAIMKKAMAFVITKLTPVDRLSIVTFSDAATRLSPLRSMTANAKEELKALVDGLQAGDGGSNIEAGLETGLAVIADRVNTKARVASIFLISDGHQTSGDARKVDPGQVATIYTFGLGKDTDHELMTDIAAKSPGGTFSSVAEHDGVQVTVPFSQLLGGLLTVVAQDVELTMTKDGDVDTINVPFGVDYTQVTDADTGVITIKFGALFAGERRRVVVTVTLKDVSAGVGEEYDAVLAETQLSFAAQGKARRDRQMPQDIQITRTPTPSQAAATRKKAFALATEASHGRQVMRTPTPWQAATGKSSNARQEDVDGTRSEDGQKLVVETLRGELQQLMALMDTQKLYEPAANKGRLDAAVTVTSHGRQRYGARGDDKDDVRLFATPRMDAYLEQPNNFDKDTTAATPSGDEDVKKQEIVGSPLGNAIEALQAIEMILNPRTTT